MKLWQRNALIITFVLVVVIWGFVFVFLFPTSEQANGEVPTLFHLSDAVASASTSMPDDQTVIDNVQSDDDALNEETDSSLPIIEQPIADIDEARPLNSAIPRQSLPTISIPAQAVPNRIILNIDPATEPQILESYSSVIWWHHLFTD